ncbi:MAG: OmpA family protein, partial [Pseudobdellovibrio sp.]
NSQALVPALYLTIHGNHRHKQSTSKVEENTVISTVKEVVDSDKDGISDEDDKCPNTPANAVVNAYGCAETQKASIKLNVVFASGKTDLTAGQKTEIDNLANFMKKYPETSVEIAGHTDNTGSAKVNNALSQKRAESVAAALVAAGIEKSRVTAKGYGSSQPVADNKTADGRAQNRRVMAEISVTVVKTKK